MRPPPARDREGGDRAALGARRATLESPTDDETLAGHLLLRLTRAEQAVRDARIALAASEEARDIIARAARQLADRADAAPTDLVRLALPRLGDWCIIEVAGGEHAERSAITRLPEHESHVAALRGSFRAAEGGVGLARALAVGHVESHDVLLDSMGAGEPDEVRAALHSLSQGPVLVVPIFLQSRIAASLTFGRGPEAMPYLADDERLGVELGRLVALSVEQRRSVAAADLAAQAKSDFLAMMSHELRTPLNAIAGYAQLLDMGFRGPLNEAQREAVGRILRGQEHLLELVDGVLTFSRLTSGRLVLDEERLPASVLVDRASEPLVQEFASHGIDFRVLACDGEDAVVRADAERAPQILRQLLGNALKFTPSGGTVTIQCEPSATTVRFVVSDTGRGIPESHQDAIFRPFVQVERGLTRTVDGSGLGLAIGRELAERMGGSLTVRSTPGEGATFVLTLPRGDVETPERVAAG